MNAEKEKKYSSSGKKIFEVLDVLLRNFATGFTIKDLSAATGFKTPSVVFYLNTLIEVGYAEKIAETDRYRPSILLPRKVAKVAQSLENQIANAEQLMNRINAGD